jgi:Zn-dependent peptidase ImmA (M78 family)
MPPRNFQRFQIATAAKKQLESLERSHQRLLQDIPVKVSNLAEALGIVIRRDRKLRERARLEMIRRDGRLSAVVTLQEKLPLPEARFALAHEIGHFLLLTDRPGEAAGMTVNDREIFANTFAAELSIPRARRDELRAQFRAVRDPLELLALGSRLGVAVSILLRFASETSDWFGDLQRIWLRVKNVPNEYTGKDPRLRIVSAHYDRRRYYVPVNQSLFRVTADAWLGHQPIAEVARERGTVNIFLSAPGSTPKFTKATIPAMLAAVRLQPSAADLASYFLISAELDGISEASVREVSGRGR